jgi:hypothetical protein
MADWVRDLERQIGEARKIGDIRALLDIAGAAIDKLEAAAGTGPGALDETGVVALTAAKRIGYNVAADVWPGWEIGTPARSEAELTSAQALARRSSAFVNRLGLGAIHRGNAIWLIGALDLALGRRVEACKAFGAAATFCAEAPAMKLLSEGYAVIAAEASALSQTESESKLAAIIASLDELGSDQAKAFRDQLRIARQVFEPGRGGDDGPAKSGLNSCGVG